MEAVGGEKILMNPDEIASYFLPGGGVEKAFGEGYEFRKEQQSVTREITSAFNGDSISLLEAPTGIGKTLSYLLPSVKWSLLNGERVLISTNTINLQDQIINKDMPILREILGRDVRYSLVKGMRNYLCLLRAGTVKTERRALFSKKTGSGRGKSGADETGSIIEWAQQATDGSISDLAFTPSEETWDKFAAESDSCIRRDCPHYNECFFFRARRKIAESNLIVVNHHLLFSDISIKDSAGREDVGVLPQARRVVIDEAHNIVEAATSHFTLRTSTLGVLKTLNRLRRVISYCGRLVKNKKSGATDSVVVKTFSHMEEVFTPRIENVEIASGNFFDSLYDDVSQYADREGGSAPNGYGIRINNADIENGGWGAASACPEMMEHIAVLSNTVREAVSILDESKSDEAVAGVIAELKAVLSGLTRHGEALGRFSGTADEFVKSVETGGKKGRKRFVAVSISPIDIAPELEKKLYDRCATLIMTSATLRVENSFGFQKRSLGFEENKRLNELAVPSPFDYKSQALLALPTDLPGPSEGGAHAKKISEAAFDLIRSSGGGAFVLFTSYQLLKKVSAALSPKLAGLGIKVLIQGDAPREKLLADFRADKNAALFGTDSFREGVDITGDALRLVIITRLPFHVPTEPVFQARMDAIRERGEDAFGNYAVPMAVINFRQAFGRLIRTTTDRGAVVVLDSRIVSRPYGRRFVESIPECRVVRGGIGEVVGEVEGFLK